MKKKKQIKIFLIASFILCAGILYTVTYLRPWKKEILLDDSITSDESLAETESAKSLTPDIEKEDVSPNQTSERTQYVHICGEVRNPGVYEVSSETRLNDAVKLAGGLTKKAAAECVNLAEVVEDGRQYYIPSREEAEKTPGVKANAVEAGSKKRADGAININTATKEELKSLPGVGDAKADAIIEYRETISRFETIEDITKVNGIKTGLLQKIRDQVVVE